MDEDLRTQLESSDFFMTPATPARVELETTCVEPVEPATPADHGTPESYVEESTPAPPKIIVAVKLPSSKPHGANPSLEFPHLATEYIDFCLSWFALVLNCCVLYR